MKVTINISKEDIEHLKGCSSEGDACWVVDRLVKKIKIKLGVKRGPKK